MRYLKILGCVWVLLFRIIWKKILEMCLVWGKYFWEKVKKNYCSIFFELLCLSWLDFRNRQKHFSLSDMKSNRKFNSGHFLFFTPSSCLIFLIRTRCYLALPCPLPGTHSPKDTVNRVHLICWEFFNFSKHILNKKCWLLAIILLNIAQVITKFLKNPNTFAQ